MGHILLVFFMIDYQFFHCLFVQLLQWNFVFKVHWKVNVLNDKIKVWSLDQICHGFATSHLSLLDPGCLRPRPWNMSRPVFSLSRRLCPPAASSVHPAPPAPHRTKERFSVFHPRPDDQPPSPHYKQTTRRGLRCWRGTQDTPALNMCEVGGERWCRGWLQNDHKGCVQIQVSVSGVGIRLG